MPTGALIESACGQKSTVHLRAVDPIDSRGRFGPVLVREPGRALCGKPDLLLHPVPGVPADCRSCLTLASRHGLVMVERSWPPVALTVVRPAWPRQRWTHYRTDEGLDTVLFVRKPGQLLCRLRNDRRQVEMWPAARGAATCPQCQRHADQLGYVPQSGQRGRCPFPGCPVAWRLGGDRFCREHAPEKRHDRAAGPPRADPYSRLRARIAADLADMAN